jgi:hypothetical protein
MSRAEKNAQAALDWAKKKKEQMEKAKRLREERKAQIQMTAENSLSANGSTGFSDFNPDRGYGGMGGRSDRTIHDMASAPSSGHYGQYSQKHADPYGPPPGSNYSNRDRGYGSSNFRPSSNEEISEARQSLLLLKSKMKNKNPTR